MTKGHFVGLMLAIRINLYILSPGKMQAIWELKNGQRNTYIKAKQEKVKCPVDDPCEETEEG
jgi:hypothetical protein